MDPVHLSLGSHAASSRWQWWPVLPWWAGAGAFRRQRDLPGSAHCLRNHIRKRVPIAAGHCLPLGGSSGCFVYPSGTASCRLDWRHATDSCLQR